jgi:phosphocarrier protein HPr
MYQRRAVVAASVGLHARPAGLLAQTAAAGPTPVRIAKIVDGAPLPSVDASSVLSLMTLGAGHGDEVELSAEGDDAEQAVAALITLVETDLDAAE